MGNCATCTGSYNAYASRPSCSYPTTPAPTTASPTPAPTTSPTTAPTPGSPTPTPSTQSSTTSPTPSPTQPPTTASPAPAPGWCCWSGCNDCTEDPNNFCSNQAHCEGSCGGGWCPRPASVAFRGSSPHTTFGPWSRSKRDRSNKQHLVAHHE